MSVFGGSHLDVCVLINRAGSLIVTKEHLGYRHDSCSITDSYVRTHGECLHKRLDECRRSRRAIDVDRLSAIQIIFDRQQLTEAAGVIVVRMRDEDIVNVADADTSPLQTARDPGARIHDGVGTSSAATWWVVRMFGAAYIIREQSAACSANSRNVEVWMTAS